MASRSRIGSLVVDLVYLGLSPLLFLVLLVISRGFTRPKIRRGIAEKLGRALPRRDGAQPSIWVHAVSVGEVLTALPLIEALRGRHDQLDVRVSVSTFTGLEVARQNLPGTHVFYFPLDLSIVVRRFFDRLRPTAVVLLELELWPNFLLEARRRGVPVLVANGRITERSARRYALLGPLARRFFNLVTSFGAQNEAYRRRFLSLGVDEAKVEVLGNLKHDREPSPAAAHGPATRARLGWEGDGSLVLVAGCTHPGEERTLCEVYGALRARDPRLRMILAPRHVERLDPAELTAWRAPLPLVRWSALRDSLAASGPPATLDGILVVDTVGELERFYALADVVFVGGSLVPRGGHNLFEAARLEKALLFGPHHENFEEEARLLLAEGAAIRVEDAAELQAALGRLLGESEERRRLAARALEATRRLRGASQAHLSWMERHLRLYLPWKSC